MTDTQLYIAVGLPCFTIIASLVLTMVRISGVRKDIHEIRTQLRTIVER